MKNYASQQPRSEVITAKHTLEASNIKEPVLYTKHEETDVPKVLQSKAPMMDAATSKVITKEEKAQTCSEIHSIESAGDRKVPVHEAPHKASESEVASTSFAVTDLPTVIKSPGSEVYSPTTDQTEAIEVRPA